MAVVGGGNVVIATAVAVPVNAVSSVVKEKESMHIADMLHPCMLRLMYEMYGHILPCRYFIS